jgi:hypothetical protein
MEKRIIFGALFGTAALLAWSAWSGRSGGSLDSTASCEERCLARDEACAAIAAGQGGWPEQDDPDRESKCNGLCFVLRRTSANAGDACLR